MITGYVGQPGSGKSAMAVRDILSSSRVTYTNIALKGIKSPRIRTISNEDVVEEYVAGEKKDGTEILKKRLNVEFWKKVPKPVDVIFDEAHSIINSRFSASNQNKVWMQWVKLIRKMIGGSAGHYGEFLWIAQLPRNIDVDVRDMTGMYCYHILWSWLECKKCGFKLRRNSEMTSRKYKFCLNCGNDDFYEYGHKIRQWELRGYDNCLFFQDLPMQEKLRINNKVIVDIEKYFGKYDTLQYEGLWQ